MRFLARSKPFVLSFSAATGRPLDRFFTPILLKILLKISLASPAAMGVKAFNVFD